MVLSKNHEAGDEDRDSAAGIPIPIESETKAPEIFQDLAYIDRLGRKKLTNEQLIAMLYSAHMEKISQTTKANALEAELKVVNRIKNEKQNQCDVMEAQLRPFMEQNAAFVIVATVFLTVGTSSVLAPARFSPVLAGLRSPVLAG